jgi:predicted nucleic acid-binding protein
MLEDIVGAAACGDFAIASTGPEVLYRAQRVQVRYATLELDLADGVDVALAEEYETDTVPTQDRRDFRTVLPLIGHKAFRVLPDDL